MKFKIFNSPLGVSLPLVTTLLVLLMIAAATAYQLILRSLNTADNIEDSSRAYFAAEAGVEDALYELSAHLPGYETPDLESEEARTTNLNSEKIRWGNQWEIKNLATTGSFSGEIYTKQKLKIHFFEDISGIQTDPESINTSPLNISPVNVADDFSLTFSVPFDNVNQYSDFFDSDTLKIDNDGDLGTAGSSGPEGVEGLNEDGKAETQNCGDGFQSKDGDCDGNEDEDSPEDPVLSCQAFDETGRSWRPLDGCLTGTGLTPEDPAGGEICEKDFQFNILSNKIEVTLNQDAPGQDTVSGENINLGTFIALNYQGRPADSQIAMECLIVAPLIQVNTTTEAKKELPYLEYAVDSTLQSGGGLPLPSFTIKSDGWYRDFKQSITTELIPKESVPLLDITIIQKN